MVIIYHKNYQRVFLQAESLVGGSQRVTLVVTFAFLPQNFGKVRGPTNAGECSLSS